VVDRQGAEEGEYRVEENAVGDEPEGVWTFKLFSVPMSNLQSPTSSLTRHQIHVKHPHTLFLPGWCVISTHPHSSSYINQIDDIFSQNRERHVGKN
jgi:hypothetical protein